MSSELRLDGRQTEAYVSRLGFAAPPPVDAAGLRALHVAHLRRLPFENLDIHLGVLISLDVADIVDKLTRRRRGGFCYELNGGFAALLRALGFDVTLLEARVYSGDGEVGIRCDHLCLRVDLDRPYLADVGFGACFAEPLQLIPGLEQDDPNGTFEIVEAGGGHLDVVNGGSAQYRFDLAPRRLDEFAAGCEYHQRSPASHFTQNTVCSLPTATGRVTVRGLTLLETDGGERREQALLDAAELGAVYRERFGVDLDQAALGRLVAVAAAAP
ncbi:MAG: arylamine N-acetyltransferase family protein [Acidimicrobiales bacterium]